MSKYQSSTLRSTLLALLLTGQSAFADPCGMVPPAYIEGQVPLQRIGLQKTYVFYKDGVETFVIRPGFQGSVEEFGMLIPFPNPPALRKIPDDTFQHIAAAVDPPEIVVDLTPQPLLEVADFAAMGAAPTSSAVNEEESLAIDEVRIVKQEAVGMYEVAVIEAGSAKALDGWMTDHGYRYPEGMDDVCNDYVKDKWCFVAIKARVGQKDGVDPKPGMSKADPSRRPGSSFDGHVQGMGFRFRSEELVVPMRLSAFNEGDLHNVVYLLTDEPKKARDLPDGHVVRQLSGEDLLKNVTEPLPLRIIGGMYEDIPETRKARLKNQRDPAPHNGIARNLFAGDLLAVSSGSLTHEHEELEKELLDIGERLGLRGKDIDVLHEQAVEHKRDQLTRQAIDDLKGMTMTVIDGDFEREIVAKENVYFTRFEIPAAKNTPRKYNARMFGPSSEGIDSAAVEASESPLSVAVAVSDPDHGRLILQDAPASKSVRYVLAVLGLLASGLAVGAMIMRRRSRSGAAALLFACLTTASSVAQEVPAEQDVTDQVNSMIDEILESTDRDAAISRVKSIGNAIPALVSVVREDKNINRRGWAIICLQEIGGPRVANVLDHIAGDGSKPPLVRTWAAAARIEDAKHFEDIQRFASLCNGLPALRRPLRLRVLKLLNENESTLSAEHLLRLTAADSQLQQALAPILLKLRPADLAKLMVTADDVNIRQQAATWLATMKTQNVKGVNKAVTSAIAFDKNADTPPWGNGPLYVPGVNWSKPETVALINELTAWFIWCEANEQRDQISKITTNLNSWQLMNAAGFRSVPSNGEAWLKEWEKIVGVDAAKELMRRTGFIYSPATLRRIEQ